MAHFLIFSHSKASGLAEEGRYLSHTRALPKAGACRGWDDVDSAKSSSSLLGETWAAATSLTRGEVVPPFPTASNPGETNVPLVLEREVRVKAVGGESGFGDTGEVKHLKKHFLTELLIINRAEQLPHLGGFFSPSLPFSCSLKRKNFLRYNLLSRKEQLTQGVSPKASAEGAVLV